MLTINKLYNMDCMKGMKEFPDNYFDAIVTDPPYSYPDANIDVNWIGEAQRISKRMFVAVGYWALQKYLKTIDDYKDIIVLRDTKNMLGRPIAFVVVSGQYSASFNTNYIEFNYDKPENIKHPCPFPFDAIRQLIFYMDNDNIKICDPFVGSGTIPIVCNLFGMAWVGFEINKTYYKEAIKRIGNT